MSVHVPVLVLCGVCLSFYVHLFSSLVYTQAWKHWAVRYLCAELFEDLPVCLAKQCSHFTLPS